MSAHEVSLAFAWLYSTLSADSTLASFAPGGVWRAMAPPSTATPFVIMGHQSGSDVVTMNAFRIMDDLLMQIKAVGPASNSATIYSAAAQIDTLLTQASGATSGGYILSCYRQSPLEVDELVSGELWTNVGGLYRIELQQTS